MLEEMCKLLFSLGKALSIAFDDVKAKSKQIAENKRFYQDVL
jgi:hypothetical protein